MKYFFLADTIFLFIVILTYFKYGFTLDLLIIESDTSIYTYFKHIFYIFA